MSCRYEYGSRRDMDSGGVPSKIELYVTCFVQSKNENGSFPLFHSSVRNRD